MARPDKPPEGTSDGLLTQKAYARRRGWSKQYVHQLVKRGRIPLTDGKIDPAVADAALARDRDPARHMAHRATAPNGGTSEPAPPHPGHKALHGSFSKARIVREHYRALREKLEYEQQAGNLVSLEAVKDAWHSAVVEFRDSVQNAAIEMGKTVAAKYGLNAREVAAMTAGEMEKALNELSDRLRKRYQEYRRAATAKREN